MSNPKLLWKPSEETIVSSNLTRYIKWLNDQELISSYNFNKVWEWSVENIDAFWLSIWNYFNVLSDNVPGQITSSKEMPGVKWFEGTKVNYAEHIFRNSTKQHPAILFKNERDNLSEISWAELEQKVAAFQQFLKNKGIKEGDRVVAYLPNIPEATVAFLAVNSIGAIWSSTSPDFGISSVVDRFSQIEPKLLITVDGYQYGGKPFDKTEEINAIIKELPSLQNVVLLPYLNPGSSIDFHSVSSWEEALKTKNEVLSFQRVKFNHPIWVLYSSGTTGKPKAITHSHGGVLLEHLKYLTFHNDVKPGERCFWYTTTGWMMWNYIQAAMLCGATIVLYDGSPAYPDMNAMWKLIEEAQITHFGTSAGFVAASMKANVQPGKDFDLNSLRSIGSTGSPLSPEGFDWIYEEVKKELWLASISGGTDVCSAFVGGNPRWPVYSGEIQCRALGCKLEAYNNDGYPVTGEMGEMVISEPMPSMPIYFWGDDDFKKYKESYFEMYPGKWRHGDWTEITERNGVIIYGRSDSTLNRGGIRIGTSEIYRAVESLEFIADSLVIYLDQNKKDYMPLFVVLKSEATLTSEQIKKIKSTIRESYTPRHVPDEVIQIPEVPYTISGKKMETPIKKIIQGQPAEKVISKDAMKNPDALSFFIDLANM
ncbi:MAG: acetoacetate--CoA ligase [Cyclobacteriaceae bacterium]|nr:acetoacetate--CoA ligase [Cyclobacteriaceae bacterium]